METSRLPISAASPRSLRQELAASLLCLLAVAVVFGTALGHDFMLAWDDLDYVVGNPAVRGFSLENLRAAFGRSFFGNYAPLHILSYQLDYTLWGLRPAGFILTNLLLHLLNGLLLRRLLLGSGVTANGALLATLLFLLHPVQVESVVWVSERKNLLAMSFFLVAWLAYVDWRRVGGSWRYGVALLAATAALLTKSVAVILPLVLLLQEQCWSGDRSLRQRRWPALLPFMLLAAAAALLTILTQDLASGGGRRGWHGGSPWATLLTMLPVFASYLRQLVWPVGLSPVYMPEIRQGVDGAVLLGGMLLVGYLGVTVWCWFRQRRLAGWLLLFLAGLLPVSQLVPLATLQQDRYLYFPLIGLAALAAEGAGWLERSRPRWSRLVWGGAGCAVLLLAVTARQRVPYWRDSLTLWQAAVATVPNCHVAWANLGESRFRAGDFAGANFALRQALQIDPEYRDPLYLLGLLSLSQGEPATARSLLERLLTAWPTDGAGQLALAMEKLQAGDLSAVSRLLAVPPSQAGFAGRYWQARVALAERQGDATAAVAARRQAVMASGSSSEADYQAAVLAVQLGKLTLALEELERALANGFSDAPRLAVDLDLAPLRQLPAFRQHPRLAALAAWR